jgi:hypothetical protein
MTRSAAIAALPRLMGEAAAAAYIGVSPSTLRSLPIPRKALGARRLYERVDLDSYADSLPYEDEIHERQERAACDSIFGVSG